MKHSASRLKQGVSGITRHASLFYLLALLCFALGLMSKPMLVTVPFVLLLLDYWPLRRLQLGSQGSHPGNLLRLLQEKLPFFALSAASSVVTFFAQQTEGAVISLDRLPLAGWLANALVAYARYIGELLWPENLSILYLHPGHWPAGEVIGSAGPVGGNFGRGALAGPLPARVGRRLALVSGHAGPGHRPGAGWHPVHRRPLHLSAVHRLFPGAGLGPERAGRGRAVAGAGLGRRGRPGPDGLRVADASAVAILARQRDALPPRSSGHGEQLSGI